MKRFCFDFPREVFPFHHQFGFEEGYGRFSGWLPDSTFKRSGYRVVYNPLSCCFPLHKPNFCFSPYEKPLCGGVGENTTATAWVDRSVEKQVSFFLSTYQDINIPEDLLKDLCTEATVDFFDRKAVQSSGNCLGFRSCEYRSALGAVYYPSGADMQQITIGLLMSNESVNRQTEMVASDVSYHSYSSTYAGHCVQDVEHYKMPSPIKEVSTTCCQGKDLLGIRSQYHCAVFSDRITSVASELVQEYENNIRPECSDTTGDLDFLQFQCAEHLGVVRCSNPTSAFCINPQVVGEAMLITEDGTMNLWNLDASVIQPYRSLAIPNRSHWWNCCYGAHPRQAVVADVVTVSLLDLRSATKQLTPLNSFDQPSIRALSPHPIQPYHFVIASSESLLVFDTRRPFLPVCNHVIAHWSIQCNGYIISVIFIIAQRCVSLSCRLIVHNGEILYCIELQIIHIRMQTTLEQEVGLYDDTCNLKLWDHARSEMDTLWNVCCLSRCDYVAKKSCDVCS